MAFSFGNDLESEDLPMSEINITPFVDVMLVLLVVFMVTAPMMTQGQKVDLPQVAGQAALEGDERVTLSLTKEKKIFLGDQEVTFSKLKEVLKHSVKLKKDQEIFIEADQALTHGFVMQVMGVIQAGGISRIGLISRPDTGKRK